MHDRSLRSGTNGHGRQVMSDPDRQGVANRVQLLWKARASAATCEDRRRLGREPKTAGAVGQKSNWPTVPWQMLRVRRYELADGAEPMILRIPSATSTRPLVGPWC